MGRHELSDAAYALIEPLLPLNDGKTGRPWSPHRPIINGILWRLHTGAQWRDIPERYGSCKTIYDRYVWWRRDGTWDRIIAALQLQLDTRGLIDTDQWAIDGTMVRAHRGAAGAQKKNWDGDDEPADHALGRSVGGFSTKIHLVADRTGVPLAVSLTGGQVHESTQVEMLMDSVAIPRANGRVRRRPRRLAADRAYAAKRIRQWLRHRGIRAVIPARRRTGKRKPGRPPSYNRAHYRDRSAIEQCVGWLKECRAVATRFEKLALNYLGLVKLACMERHLRLLTRNPEPNPA